MKILINAAVIAITILIGCNTASAHIIIENFKGRAGYNEFLTLMVPHGCGPLATTELRMKVPASVVLFAPEQKAGWETEIVMRKLDAPVQRGRTTVSEVYDEVIWRGNLPSSQLGVFRFLARIPNAVGSVVPFKLIQKCGEQEDRWIDTIADGEPAWKMWATPMPSPFVEVIDAGEPQLGATMQQLQEARQNVGKSPE